MILFDEHVRVHQLEQTVISTKKTYERIYSYMSKLTVHTLVQIHAEGTVYLHELHNERVRQMEAQKKQFNVQMERARAILNDQEDKLQSKEKEWQAYVKRARKHENDLIVALDAERMRQLYELDAECLRQLEIQRAQYNAKLDMARALWYDREQKVFTREKQWVAYVKQAAVFVHELSLEIKSLKDKIKSLENVKTILIGRSQVLISEIQVLRASKILSKLANSDM